MKSPFRGFWEQRRVRAVASIAAGSAFGQFLAFLALPFISRAFSPTELGVFTIVNASATILSAVITLRLERALAIPKDEETAQGLALLGLSCIGILTSILVALSFRLSDPLAEGLGIPNFSGWVWAIPTLAALIAVFVLLNQLAVRHERYRAIATRNAVQPGAVAGTQLILANAVLPGLVVGALLGRTLGIIGLVRGSGLKTHLLAGTFTVRRAKSLLSRYWRFPVLNMPAGLLNVLNLMLPPILIAAVYTVPDTGQFGIAFQLVTVPVVLVGAAVGQVFLGRFAQLVHQGEHLARRFFFRVSIWLAGAAVVVAVLIWFGGTLLIPIILGSKWDLAGSIASLLSFAVAGRLIAAPVTSALSVLEKHKTLLVLSAMGVMSSLIVFSAAEYFDIDFLETMVVYSFSQSALYLATWLMCMRAVLRHRT